MIQLRTLGAVGLTGVEGDQADAVLTQPKRLALLTYLVIATPRGFHRRDTLLGLFWPELDQPHARGSLRKAVHVLRRALGADVLIARGDEELAVATDRLWCDATAFEQLAAQGDVSAALELYGGDLLQGVFISGAPEFERWLDGARARLRARAADLAWSMARQAATDLKTSDATRWARHAAAFTPDDEAALRDLVSLLYQVGDRAGALRAYNEFAVRMEQEFGTRPSAMTRRLVENVRLSRDVELQSTKHRPPP